ncbi:YihY/virulence factor BrkB family protein [Nemorincola caseinilytica]
MTEKTNDRKTGRKPISLKGMWRSLKDAVTAMGDDKVMKLSGSLAYYTVFSMGPLLVVIISLCSLFFARDAVEGQVYAVLRDFVGSDTALQLQDIIKNAAIGNKSTTAAIIGGVTLLIGATTVFAEIQDSINGIWGLKPKPKKGLLIMLRNRLMSFSVIIGLGFILLVSLAITGVIESISTRVQLYFPQVTVVVFYIINLSLSFIISVFIFAVIFKVLPDAHIKWRDVVVGAFATAILFLIGKFGISLYISQTKVGSTYGAAGSLVILLVWVYYSSMILYLGAEFTKAYAIQFGSEIHPNDYAVTTKQVEIETGHKSVQEKEQVTVVKKHVP